MSRDLLIRGIAEEVLKELGHQAVEKGVSRSELIRIILEKEVETTSSSKKTEHDYQSPKHDYQSPKHDYQSP